MVIFEAIQIHHFKYDWRIEAAARNKVPHDEMLKVFC